MEEELAGVVASVLSLKEVGSFSLETAGAYLSVLEGVPKSSRSPMPVVQLLEMSLEMWFLLIQYLLCRCRMASEVVAVLGAFLLEPSCSSLPVEITSITSLLLIESRGFLSATDDVGLLLSFFFFFFLPFSFTSLLGDTSSSSACSTVWILTKSSFTLLSSFSEFEFSSAISSATMFSLLPSSLLSSLPSTSGPAFFFFFCFFFSRFLAAAAFLVSSRTFSRSNSSSRLLAFLFASAA